ncbi:hypothetical protein [Candidatus Izimaplasma sp. ZiA1]|uniref:hypothetical protein n=1 Tax=Candidatus Izimoplasma sp. ZiA1 TaxID=2024899 RepID=UPI001F0A986B
MRFRDFTDSWIKTSLGDQCSKPQYGMNAAAIPFDGTNKYIRITDIDEGSNTYKPNPLVSPKGTLDDDFLVKEGDILFARTGASTGKS